MKYTPTIRMFLKQHNCFFCFIKSYLHVSQFPTYHKHRLYFTSMDIRGLNRQSLCLKCEPSDLVFSYKSTNCRHIFVKPTNYLTQQNCVKRYHLRVMSSRDLFVYYQPRSFKTHQCTKISRTRVPVENTDKFFFLYATAKDTTTKYVNIL